MTFRQMLGGAAPLLVLVSYALAFAAATLGGGVPAGDDHPGQMYRLWHVVRAGLAPWAWDAGWWAGYPELQFYPPGFAYAGALFRWLSLQRLPVALVYQALVWLACILPALTTYAALNRILGSGWQALPGAVIALTLSAEMTSGVEGGVRTGMVGARLAWALLPAILWLLVPFASGARQLGVAVPALIAAVVLLHPAQAPAALALIVLAACWRAPRRARLGAAVTGCAIAAALVAFWALPLLVRLAHTRALAWGTLALAEWARPLPLALIAGAALVPLARRTPLSSGAALALAWLPAAAAVTALVRWGLEPLGLRWLPSDRVVDGVWMSLVVAGGVAAAWVGRRLSQWLPPPAAALVVVAAIAVLAADGRTLRLWPRATPVVSLATLERGLRLPALWKILRELPEGRVLFLRSSVPLAYGTEWWRPHTHVMSLAPVEAERAIVHGTFTHPSPVAALLYRGDAGPGAITELVERLDGRTLFGRPLPSMNATQLQAQADRLGVVAVVALQDDLGALGWLADDPVFRRRREVSQFVVFARETGVSVPTVTPDGGWHVVLDGTPGAWTSARLAFYPLWRAETAGTPLPTRRGADGLLEVRLQHARQDVTLRYAPGLAEIAGVALSAGGLLAWGAMAWRERRPRAARARADGTSAGAEEATGARRVV